MSIKQVTCPKCKATMNVAASMTSMKCNACGSVFSEGAAPSPAGGGSNPYAASNAPIADQPGAGKGKAAIVVGGVIAVAVGIMLFLALFLTVPSAAPAPMATPPMAQPAQASASASGNSSADEANAGAVTGGTGETAPDYRVVDLPESTRQKIYRDYKKMIASSFGKAKKIPKGGAAGQSLQKMLGGTVDREITHMALIHNITEEDIAQIVAEGEAKGW